MSNEQKIEVNGITLNVIDSRTPGAPVIFIHPFPFNLSVWKAQFERLTTTNRVITFDIRGFGGSTMDNKKSSIGLYADDLVQMMDHLNLDQAVVCGLSMGGYILLDAVERYPSRFKALILCDTQCVGDSKEQQQIRYESIKKIETIGLGDFSEQFIQKALSANTLEHNKHLSEQLAAIILSNSPAAVTSGMGAMAQRNETCSKLSKISVPTLVISGKEDSVIMPSQSEFLFNNIPGAQLQIIEKAGHLSNIEQPEAFNKIIQSFISKL